jgi:hypothetical protein
MVLKSPTITSFTVKRSNKFANRFFNTFSPLFPNSLAAPSLKLTRSRVRHSQDLGDVAEVETLSKFCLGSVDGIHIVHYAVSIDYVICLARSIFNRLVLELPWPGQQTGSLALGLKLPATL